MAVSGPIISSRRRRSTVPSLRAGISDTLCPIRRSSSAHAETAGCSTEEISTFPGVLRVFICPSSARLSLSVPPEVNIILHSSAPAARRQASRTLSIRFWISMDGLYKADGLYHPLSASSRIRACTDAPGRVVALLSRYTVMILLPPGAHRDILTDKANQFVTGFQNNHLLILFLCEIEEIQFCLPIQEPVHPFKSRHIEIPPESI